MMYAKQSRGNEARMLRLFFYVLKLGGVLTISLRSKTTSKVAFRSSSPTFVRSKLGIAYNVLLIFLVLVGSYYSVHYAYYYYDGNDRLEFERIADAIQTALTVVTALFILVLFIVRQEATLKLANQLLAAYKSAQNIQSRVDQQRVRLGGSLFQLCLLMYFVMFVGCTNAWCIFHLMLDPMILDKCRACGMKLILITHVISATLLLSTIPYNFGYDMVRYFLSVHFFNLVINTFFMQYSLTLMLLGYCFAVINDDLLDLKEQKTNTNPPLLSLKIIGGIKVQRLEQLRVSYVALTKLSRIIADFYSFPMLVCSANAFLTITDYLYYFVKPIVLRSYYAPAIVRFHCGAQVIFPFASLVVLTSSARTVISQSDYTGEIMNECLSNSQDDQIAKTLISFSNFILHKNIKFTVSGLFPLDGSMLMGIISSITTYLVILLQFKESGSKEENLEYSTKAYESTMMD